MHLILHLFLHLAPCITHLVLQGYHRRLGTHLSPVVPLCQSHHLEGVAGASPEHTHRMSQAGCHKRDVSTQVGCHKQEVQHTELSAKRCQPVARNLNHYQHLRCVQMGAESGANQ